MLETPFACRELTTGAGIRQDQKGNRGHPLYRGTEKQKRRRIRFRIQVITIHMQEELYSGLERENLNYFCAHTVDGDLWLVHTPLRTTGGKRL
jgi:hypothetical protein